ncbi:MAG: hypothetical protein KKE16_07455 [Firmicutes bacterium]|nr:hypothetical protein [Bacillota bacterium]
MFLVNWKIIIEISLLVLFFIGAIAVSSVFLIRSVVSSYKEVFKLQSKLDIELRKILNLISKISDDEIIDMASSQTVKELPLEEKKKLIIHVDEIFNTIDLKNPDFSYLKETYENLHEVRRTRDGRALMYNQKIAMFPFNLYAKILKLPQWEIYTDIL